MNQTTSPREKQVARFGPGTTLVSRSYPRVLAGTCEHCGVLNPNVAGELQYKFCPHYNGMELKCSFCKENADHPQVVRMSEMLVRDDPHNPNQLVVLCKSYDCMRKYEEKYQLR